MLDPFFGVVKADIVSMLSSVLLTRIGEGNDRADEWCTAYEGPLLLALMWLENKCFDSGESSGSTFPAYSFTPFEVNRYVGYQTC